MTNGGSLPKSERVCDTDKNRCVVGIAASPLSVFRKEFVPEFDVPQRGFKGV
jgi:hypothetical protein